MTTSICMPARYNSKRLPAKLVADFKDKTTIQLTYEKVLKNKYVSEDDIYIFYEKNDILKNHINSFCKKSIETEYADCGTERIANNLYKLPKKYDFICIIQCDEPFIDSRNIDYCLENHKKYNNTFFSTLYHKSNNIPDISDVKLVTDIQNNVLYYSRNNIPGIKNKLINTTYKTSTGIYIYNYDNLKKFLELENTPLYEIENIEQLKVLENGYKIKSFEAPYFVETSLDTQENYDYLINKYYS